MDFEKLNCLKILIEAIEVLLKYPSYDPSIEKAIYEIALIIHKIWFDDGSEG